ncbi:hypothetical protein CRG98_023218 [Punica granatum]|uniref:Uncharacterized protein n=1 Tax=Punica granatum TaxID=22663 RepID=A0A2I0JJF2_PUNGR|nr:hypothetical protein CRG98_023218 [Punica granatum]
MFVTNRDHSDPRTPRDIRKTLRKPQSQVPRSSRANGPRSETTSERPHETRGSPRRTIRHTKGNRRPGALNSTPNVRTGQNRLSRRRVTRTLVPTTDKSDRVPRHYRVRTEPSTSAISPHDLGFGTFGTTHGHLDPSLRCPTSPTSHRTVAGASVPTHFPETAVAAPPLGSLHP